MALPKQVQQQLVEAEQLEQQILAQPPEVPQEPEIPPIAEPPVAAAPAAIAPTESVEEWQQRYKSMKGRYDAEVPKLHQAVKERDAQLNSIQQRLAQLEAKPQERPKVETLVTTQDDEKFGSDLIELMRRVVREGIAPVVQRLEPIEQAVKAAVPQMQREVRQTAEDVAATRADRFWSELNTAIPDWQAINDDPKFLAWLTEYDPIAGATRQVALDAASGALDHQRVIAVFKLYKGSTGAPTPKPTQNSDLARQVAPAKSAKTAAPPQGEKTFTGAQYEYWHDPRRFHDTPKDQLAATHAELERALTEGRIKF